jgi:CRP/FNR family transcriptional regulator
MNLIDLLRNVEMFEGLTAKQLKKLAYIFIENVLHAGEVIFSQGDKSENLFLVKSGFIEVITDSPDTKMERVIRILGHGQSVGEMSWVDRGTRSATVRAVTKNTILAVASFDALDEICKRNPKIGYRLFRNIAADLSFRFRQDAGSNSNRQVH